MSLSKLLLRRIGLPVFSVGVSPTSVSGFSTTQAIQSGPATVTAVGGSGTRTYAWSRVSGDAGITAGQPSSATTTFHVQAPLGTWTAVFKCTVTDTVTSDVLVTENVSVSLTRGGTPPPTLTLSATNASQSGASDSAITVTASSTASASGGSGSYVSYSWPDIFLFAKSPSGNVCYYSATGLGPGQSKSGSGTVYVIDSNGTTAGDSFTVFCENTGTAPPAFSVSASPSGVSGAGSTSTITTESATATASGAVGGVTWSWVRTSGVGSAGSSSSATTTFSVSDMVPYVTVYGTFRVTGTDSLGRTAYADVSASFERGSS